MRKTLRFLTIAASLSLAGVAVAQDDSSATAASFPATVAGSEAVVIRVPVDANGREVAAKAEMRVTDAADRSTSAVADAFEAGVAVGRDALIDEDSDSSTSRYNSCGWNNYYSYGTPSYGYQSYRPTYSYYQSSWSYSYSYSYQSSYSGWGNYNSYNYYYYQRSERSYYGSSAGWHHGW